MTSPEDQLVFLKYKRNTTKKQLKELNKSIMDMENTISKQCFGSQIEQSERSITRWFNSDGSRTYYLPGGGRKVKRYYGKDPTLEDDAFLEGYFETADRNHWHIRNGRNKSGK
jgi:hypothetical protein